MYRLVGVRTPNMHMHSRLVDLQIWGQPWADHVVLRSGFEATLGAAYAVSQRPICFRGSTLYHNEALACSRLINPAHPSPMLTLSFFWRPDGICYNS